MWDNVVLAHHLSFLQFWYPWILRMKILGNATLAPLGNLHNMQMKVAITDNSFFDSQLLR